MVLSLWYTDSHPNQQTPKKQGLRMSSKQSGSTGLSEKTMNREAFLQRLAQADQPWDMAIVGGGATGAGIALDAAARGYRVVLLERSDFGKGTSSRPTKLVHGGVR